MSKITRKSFKRKKIITGVALFGAVGLVSTGFAAWVLSSSVTEQKQLTLSVAAVSDKNMEFVWDNAHMFDTSTLANGFLMVDGGSGQAVQYDGAEVATGFIFDSQKDDNVGRVRWDGTNYAITSITIFGKVKNSDHLGSIKVGLSPVNNVVTIPEALTAAQAANYIVLPACFTARQEVTYLSPDGTATSSLASSKYVDDGVTYTNFKYTIEFGWGELFGNDNPSVYYDNAGASIDKDVVKATLEAFHETVDSVLNFSVDIVADPVGE